MTENETNKTNPLQNRKKKNLAVLTIIAAFVVIIWAITMIKIGNLS